MPENNFSCVVKIKKLTPAAHVPQYAHFGDSGADLFSTEDCSLQPMERHAVSTGLLGNSHEVTKTQKITKKRSQNTSVSFRTRLLRQSASPRVGISKGGQQPR